MASKVNYQDYRAQMQDGDILLFKGQGPLSSIIKWKTNSSYSHAGIVAWWGDRLMVLEACGGGVRATPISYNLKSYKGDIDYLRTKEPLEPEARKKMVRFAQSQLGKKYDVLRLIEFFIRLLKNDELEREENVKVPSTYFCSEYVAETYVEGGCDLSLERSAQYTSPDIIASSDKLEFVGTLLDSKTGGSSVKVDASNDPTASSSDAAKDAGQQTEPA